jgi:hypothetical protein
MRPHPLLHQRPQAYLSSLSHTLPSPSTRDALFSQLSKELSVQLAKEWEEKERGKEEGGGGQAYPEGFESAFWDLDINAQRGGGCASERVF